MITENWDKIFITFLNLIKLTEEITIFSFLFSSKKEFLYMMVYENYLNWEYTSNNHYLYERLSNRCTQIKKSNSLFYVLLLHQFS